MNLDSAAREAWAGLDPATEVSAGGQRRDIGAHRPRATLATLRPASVAGVREIARRERPVWPVSTGCNWGQGSRMPPADEFTVVDLRRLSRIRALDRDGGVAVVEPGVTQAQLAWAVEGTGWQVNLTGSCAETSVVGNTMAGGDGVFRPRGRDVTGTEIVVPGGSVQVTGSLAGGAAGGPAGLAGPGAVMTALAVQLTAVPEDNQIVHAQVAPGRGVDAVERLRACVVEGVQGGMPRLYSGGVIVPVAGARLAVRDQVRTACRILRATPGLDRVRVVPAEPARRASDPLSVVAALLTGHPTCRMVREAFGVRCAGVDAQDRGWLVVLPLLPLAGGAVAAAAVIWQEAARAYGLPVVAEIILVSPDEAHAVLQITFDRADSARAHALKDTLVSRLQQAGMPLYRCGIDDVQLAGAGPRISV